MTKKKEKVLQESRIRRHHRVRRKIRGTQERPRLAVFRSGKHIWAQLIDDEKRKTIIGVTDFSREFRNQLKGTKSEKAFLLGEILARKAREKGITRVVFDRGGFLYQGRIKRLADGARAGGLIF